MITGELPKKEHITTHKMSVSLQTDQAMGSTIEKSWFDSKLGKETSLLSEAPAGLAASAVGSFHGAEVTGGRGG